MSRTSSRLTGLLLLFAGCCYPVREQVDSAICEQAQHPIDAAPRVADQALTPIIQTAHHTLPDLPSRPDAGTAIQPGQPERPRSSDRRPDPLEIPPGLPGAEAKPIEWPESPAEKEKALRDLYPALPPLGRNPEPQPGPDGRPLALADLQRLAVTNSPLLRQPRADVESARGSAIQAGAYPNPSFGYQWDTAGTGGTAGFQGFFIEQTIRTAGKIKLGQAIALIDLMNAEVAYRRAQSDVATQVRTAYFAALVAQESVRVSEALARLTDAAFRIQVEQVPGGVAAPYEPMQLRVLAYQARDALASARNTYVSSWKQLAAAVGLPAMPPTQLAGRADMPVPVYSYEAILPRVLSNHTDVRTAENGLQRARYNLRLAQVMPVPDVSLHLAVEHDFTVPPFQTTTSGTIGLPVPLWDRNRGNILQAQAALLRAVEEPHRVRDDLTGRLADAFRRYESNRTRLRLYRDHILPDQVRVYQGVRQRHNWDPDAVSFGDVVTAQQTLAQVIITYVGALGDMWTAVTDIANLLQTNDLYQVGAEPVPTECAAPVPDLVDMLTLPCCHPCTALPDPRLKGAEGSWPRASEDDLETLPAIRR